MGTTPHVIDLAAVGAVVGRFHIGGSRPQWAIVDQSGELAHTVFTDETEGLQDIHDL